MMSLGARLQSGFSSSVCTPSLLLSSTLVSIALGGRPDSGPAYALEQFLNDPAS